MEHRRAHRFKTRLPCELMIDGRRHSGVILNVSPVGCFAQTSAQPPIGATVEARIHAPSEGLPIALNATVVSKQLVPPALRTVAHGGIGLSIQYAPASYYTYLATLRLMENPAT